MHAHKKKKRGKITVRLSEKDVATLEKLVRSGSATARTITRARILLLSHRGKKNRDIEEALSCSHDMLSLVRSRYRERGSIEAAITDLPRPGHPKKITTRHEAFVVATACTDAPPGHDHWTIPELRKALLKQYKKLRSVSDERVRQMLIASKLKPWREKNVVRPGPHAALSRAHG